MTSYSSLEPKKKAKIRQILDQNRSNIKETKKLIENTILKTLDEQSYLTDLVKHDQISIEQYLLRQQKLATYIQTIFKTDQKPIGKG